MNTPNHGVKRSKMSAPKKMKVGTLDFLPVEILLIICDHIDANTLLRSLMYVNKQFYNIIRDTYLWKKRAKRTFNDREVVFMMTNTYNENTFNWKKFNWHTERETNYWSSPEKNTIISIYKTPIYSKVDSVLLNKYGTLCLSAMEDRCIYLWDIKSRNPKPIVYKTNSHYCRINYIKSYDDNHFLSCSWDKTVKLWDMFTFSKTAIPATTYSAESPVISVTSKNNFIAAGLRSPKVVAFDQRSYKSIFQLRPHTACVLDLCLVKDNFLVSLSLDQCLSICDLRMHQTVKNINLFKDLQQPTSFPARACYYEDNLFVCDNKYDVYWLDCSDGLFNKNKTLTVSKNNENGMAIRIKLNGIVCSNYGSIISGANKGCISIMTPTFPPIVIKKCINFRAEITSMDYKHDTLAVGFMNNEVRIWQRNDV